MGRTRGIMATITDLKTSADFQALLAASVEVPVILFKHSTRCGTSSWAWQEFQSFVNHAGDGAEFFRVLVVENRSLSTEIARYSGIIHQSPQAILFRYGQAIWDASHGGITMQALANALAKADL